MGGDSERRCIFCGGTPVTREHIFRSAWRTTLPYVVGEREWVQHRLTSRRQRPDRPFELVVKRTCAGCNNGWMNDLDTHVEPWLLNPAALDFECDPTEFRRWAIKVALLRGYVDTSLTHHPEDAAALFAGDDIPGWHVFVGQSQQPEYRHAFCGVGPVIGNGIGRTAGVTQASWSLGTSLVTTFRITGTEAGPYLVKNFRSYNRWHGSPFAEVRYAAEQFPNVVMLPAVPIGLIQSFYWFTTPHDSSPIAEIIREYKAGILDAAHRSGRIADLVDD
jgi:hypothetical protein